MVCRGGVGRCFGLEESNGNDRDEMQNLKSEVKAHREQSSDSSSYHHHHRHLG